MKTNETKISPEIMLWKKLNIDYCEMEFSCGGDSMNDYSFTFHSKDKTTLKGKKVEELKDFFDSDVFHQVEFYVNSDGHYMGESGTVTITLNEEEDECFFEYSKNARSEFNESYTEVTNVELTKNEIDFLKENISNINGNIYEDSAVIYTKDLILTLGMEKTLNSITNKIKHTTAEFEIKSDMESNDDWARFTTDIGDEDNLTNELSIEEDKLKISVTKNYTYYDESY